MRYLDAAQHARLVPDADYFELVDRAWCIYGKEREVLSVPSIAAISPPQAPRMAIKGAMASALGVHGIFFGAQSQEYTFAVCEFATGRPIGLMEQSAAYRKRTAAQGVVAARYFAPRGARVAAVIGSGGIASHVVRMLPLEFQLDELRLASRTATGARAFVERLQPEVGAPMRACDSIAEAVRDADFVITISSAAEPFLGAGMLRRGAFLCSLGGGHEIDASILAEVDRLFVDDLSYALWRGDFKGWVDRGDISRAALEQRIEGDIGLVALGELPRRQADETIMAVIQGTAICDLVVAHAALERAALAGVGTVLANTYPGAGAGRS